jgi:putative sigma-54 modulation protein
VQISIDGRHIEVTDAIREYIEKKLQKLKKFFPFLIDVHVVLYTQKLQQTVEITIKANRFTVHGEERSNDLYASVDKVISKLDSQIQKYKGRIVHNHQKQPRPDKDLNLNISVYDRETVETEDQEVNVIHSKRLAIKPMSIDEAVMQMDLIDQNFLVYRNDKSKSINVIYRRNDGHYGLIEPEDE